MTFDTNSLPKPVQLNRVTISNGLWGKRHATNRNRTIPAIQHQLEKTGRLDSWLLSPDREQPKHNVVRQMFWDSDTGKWLEAVGYSLHTHPDPELERQTDEIINNIENAQQSDGYLNTWFTVLEPEKRWTNLRDWHELYNAGHLIEGAVAYYEATGKRTILDVLLRYTDLIDSLYGLDEGKKRGYPGHPEIEMALVKLYRTTGEQHHLNLAKYFLEERGQQPHYFDIEAHKRGDDPEDFWAQTYRYCQAHEPLRDQKAATGHAVRACYLYAGLADVALETQDQALIKLSQTLWDDLTSHQMYITGGLGPANSNEGFTFAYDLPNETAYAETCASIALAFWAHRMFHLDPNRRYIDVMERALYNTVLSGVSYEGDHFFYANPLASYPNVNPYEHFSGITSDQHYRREEWFDCPCCPPNLARIIASIGSYFYSATANRVYVHLYNHNTLNLQLDNSAIQLEQQTNYPWDGKILLTVRLDSPKQFDLALRIPGWCQKHSIEINGNQQAISPENGYAVMSRQWQNGDTVSLMLDMPVEYIAPHPLIRQNAGHLAIQRGPVVFCLEEVDNGSALANVAIVNNGQAHANFDSNLFGGVCVITGDAVRIEPSTWNGEMYRPQSTVQYEQSSFQFRAIPYFLWANREPGEMQVWIREA